MSFREIGIQNRFIARPGKISTSFKLIKFNEDDMPEEYKYERNNTTYYLLKANIEFNDNEVDGYVAIPKTAINKFFECWDLNKNPNSNMNMRYSNGKYIFELNEELNVFV